MNVTVHIDTGTQTYPIHIGPDLLAQSGSYLAAAGVGPRALVVTDRRVAGLYGDTVQDSLRQAGLEPALAVVPPGERSKSLSQARTLYDAALAAGLDRRSCFIALGGGVVGDLAGFVAATYMRGVPFAQLPTTLLAQVDSSVGGKTGVDLPQGKNLVGAFHQPCLVVADVRTLATLPRREVRAGLAEVIKYGLILDANLFADLARQFDASRAVARDAPAESLSFAPGRALPWSAVSSWVQRSCELKGYVVKEDVYETGRRAILNFGHTFGHAFEALLGYRRLRHGEAVSIGMVTAARLSHRLGLLTAADVARIERLLAMAGLPTAVPGDLTPDPLLASMQHDKKAARGRLRFVLLRRIGEAWVTPEVPLELVREVLQEQSDE
jgi:3-dehydroquinate synthase